MGRAPFVPEADRARWVMAVASHAVVHDLGPTLTYIDGYQARVLMSRDESRDSDTFAALARWAATINADRVTVAGDRLIPHVHIHGTVFGFAAMVTAVLEREEAEVWAHSEADGDLPLSVLEVSRG